MPEKAKKKINKVLGSSLFNDRVSYNLIYQKNCHHIQNGKKINL